MPRRVFFQGLSAVGALFVVPGCTGNPEPQVPATTDSAASQPPPDVAPEVAPSAEPEPVAPAPAVVANDAWEAEAKTLEAGGKGLYSAKEPLDQKGKEGKHVPKVVLTGESIALSTEHPTEAPSKAKPKGHMITHHYLRDAATGLVFAWKTFELKPGETAASEFTLPAGVTSFTAYQVCNLHWTWTAEPTSKV